MRILSSWAREILGRSRMRRFNRESHLIEIANEAGLVRVDGTQVRFVIDEPLTYVVPSAQGPHVLTRDNKTTLRSTVRRGPQWGFVSDALFDALSIDEGSSERVEAPFLVHGNLFSGDRTDYLALVKEHFSQQEQRDRTKMVRNVYNLSM